MAIVKDLIHTDTDKELEEQEQVITISPEEEIDRQDGPGRDDGYVPDPTPEQGVEVETEIDREPAGEVEEQISERSSGKDMDWER